VAYKIANDKIYIEDKGTGEKRRVKSDLENLTWCGREGEVPHQGTTSRFLCHKATQKCGTSPLWDTENCSRAEVFPHRPVMEGDNTCFIFPQESSAFQRLGNTTLCR